MSARFASLVSNFLLDWYRRVLYHHDYFLTCVILMGIHTILCILPVVIVPSVVCADTSNQERSNDEQFTRWLMLSLFAAVPLFLDITLDYFKATAAAVERNQWASRIILLLALTAPNVVIQLARIQNISFYNQCLLESAIIPSQTMILISSVFCTMFKQQVYVANDEDDNKSKFSIEKRSVAALFHITTSRALVFLFFLSGEDNAYKVWITVVNALVLSHVTILFIRYLWILLDERRNGEFTTAGALSDFLYSVAALMFLIVGMFVVITLQVVGVTNQKPDLAAVNLTIHRLMFLVGFNLFITVIPGRVHMLSARIEHQKLQTRLNLIRYVSHEMRSPLNTAFLGLEYVTTELSRMNTEWHNNLRAHQSFSMVGNTSIAKHGGSHITPAGSMLGGAMSRSQSDAAMAGFGSTANMQSNAGSSKTGVSDVLDTVKQINASCNIALFTLNDLLTFDKLDEKKLEVELQPVNAWHFALETAKPFKINAKDSGVDFTISCGNFESRWYRDNQLHADEFKLSQVLRNLISNALKFTPDKGKVHMQVDMIPNYPTSGILHQGSTLGQLMRISVTDTGPGISKENLHKLFGQYVQFNASKLQKGGGSGLGLWISKSIVEMHGGTVRATSEGEGHGCTFTMELPLFHKSGLIAALGGVESIPESADELDGMAGEGGDGGGGLRVSPPDLESGGGHPSQQLLASPAPAHNSLWGRIFRGRVSLTGAGQFLNQKVRFTMVYKPENAAASEEEALGESPNRNHYCINDLDEVQHAGSGAVGSDDEEEADNEEAAVHTYSSQKMVLDGFGSEKRKSAKIAGRAVSKAKIVPICEDSRGDSSATMMLACNTASVRRSVLNDENEDELVDLENQATVDTPTIASNTSSSLFVSPRSSVATSASTAATNYSKCADNGTMNSIHNSNNIDTTKKKSWSSKLRFLAVDDAALNRKMMARLLVAAGHTVDEAGDGLECLAAMNLTAESTTKGDSINAKYDCVLMDENMPNLSGPEAAQKLRQAGYKGLIIGVTGDCYQDQMDHYVHMGANAVLPKPLKLDHLRAKLEELW